METHQMLLNKVPVLDKGFVALIDSCNTTSKLREVGEELFGGDYPVSLEELGNMTVVIHCPLFVQLALSKFNFKVIDANKQTSKPELYLPNAAEIQGDDAVTSNAIADDIARTADALLINPSAYQADGADVFISQVLTPINVYTTLIVQGSYSEWCKFACVPQKFPAPIKAYTTALEQIITAEWK
jgi:hypothetical protein